MLKKQSARIKRHRSLRKRLSGTPEIPRLAVFRSNKHIYAQIIDDVAGATLASASSLEASAGTGAKQDVAATVGKLLGERAKQAGVTKAVFDRGGFKYHGRVAKVADGAREAGIEF